MTTNASGRSFLSRTLPLRESNSDESHDPKGPTGLNTLWVPTETAIADLIFVHGLGGGSQSSWSKSSDPSLYWPQEWLPKDPGFTDVRIHSFGYNSNWGKQSTLNVHDFAKSLLGSIQDCPVIPRRTTVCSSQLVLQFCKLPRCRAIASMSSKCRTKIAAICLENYILTELINRHP